ncbi:MAG: Imm31 family immunity protein [Pseudonocardiaceae bacterium]
MTGKATAKYEFYEVVRLEPRERSLERLRGQDGAVVGRAEDDLGNWTYGVHVYKLNEVWSFQEEDLRPTGRMDRRETFYDSTSVRVAVDPDTGEGEVVPAP